MKISTAARSLCVASLLFAQTLAASTCWTCDSGCIKCSSVSVQPNGGKIAVIDVSTCKGESISWACCTGSNAASGACSYYDCTPGSQDGSRAKCEGVMQFSVSVPADATSVTINTHDGRTQGDADMNNAVCGGNGNQGGGCTSGGNTAHCLVDVDLSTCTSGGGSITPGDCPILRNITIYEPNSVITPVVYPQYAPGILPHITAPPTQTPVLDPTSSPTTSPSLTPVAVPVAAPTSAPTRSPTSAPTSSPTSAPTRSPTSAPTRSPTLSPTDAQNVCPLMILDFYNYARGTYIQKNTLFNHGWGIQVYASGNNLHSKPVRVFDTAYPNTDNDGDTDLGSPNLSCGGPGDTKQNELPGGTKGAAYENCVPQGKVLILQEKNPTGHPDDSSGGGEIRFVFRGLVDIESATILDSDNAQGPLISCIREDNSKRELRGAVSGDNGLNTEVINEVGIKEFKIKFEGSGSLSSLHYRYCPPSNYNKASLSAAIASVPGTCTGESAKELNLSGQNNNKWIARNFRNSLGINLAFYGHGSELYHKNNDPYRNSNWQEMGRMRTIGNLGRWAVAPDSGSSPAPPNPNGATFRFDFERKLAWVDEAYVLFEDTTPKPSWYCMNWDGTITDEQEITASGSSGVWVQFNVDVVRECWMFFHGEAAIQRVKFKRCS